MADFEHCSVTYFDVFTLSMLHSSVTYFKFSQLKVENNIMRGRDNYR